MITLYYCKYDSLMISTGVTGTIGIEIIDIAKVKAFVRDLSDIDQQKAIRAGLAKGSMIFLKAGISRLKQLPDGGYKTGALYHSFTSRVKKRKLGALAGFDMPQGSASWLQDRGTVRRTTKKGYNRGINPASYFWKATKEQESSRAVDAVWTGIQTAMERMKNRSNL